MRSIAAARNNREARKIGQITSTETGGATQFLAARP